MKKLKIIGIGSPFGDDQLGWHVIEKLKQRSFFINNQALISLENYDRPGTHLINLLQNTDFAILVDAVKSNKAPGTIYHFVNEEIGSYSNLFSSHAMGVAETIRLASALGELPDHIVLYGIEIDSVEMQNHLSQPVQDAVVKLVEIIERRIMQQIAN